MGEEGRGLGIGIFEAFRVLDEPRVTLCHRRVANGGENG